MFYDRFKWMHSMAERSVCCLMATTVIRTVRMACQPSCRAVAALRWTAKGPGGGQQRWVIPR